MLRSLSVRRAWIEILASLSAVVTELLSLSVRRAWIEIKLAKTSRTENEVALRKESVDRNAGKAPYMENAVGRSP